MTEEGGNHIQANATIDLDLNGTYFVGGGQSDPGLGYQNAKVPQPEMFYIPESLAGGGIR